MSATCISLGRHHGGLVSVLSWNAESVILVWICHWGCLEGDPILALGGYYFMGYNVVRVGERVF